MYERLQLQSIIADTERTMVVNKNMGRDNRLTESDTPSATKKERDKKINCRGVDANAVASLNGKRVETVEVEMSELTQIMYKDLHRETSSKEDTYVVPSRKNSKRRI